VSTDTADDLRRVIAESPAHVLVAEVQGRVIGLDHGRSTAGGVTSTGWQSIPITGDKELPVRSVAHVERKLKQQGGKRITALVEKEHPWAMIFWEAVGYRVDERIVRRVRTSETQGSKSMLVDVSHVVEHGMITYRGLPAPLICDFLSREQSGRTYAPGTEFHIGKIEMVAKYGHLPRLTVPSLRHRQGLVGTPLERLANLPGIVGSC